MLCARGEDKWEPVRRNGRVEERDAETSDGNGGEDGVVHLLAFMRLIVVEHDRVAEEKNRAAGI